jgi:hypothetical protein
MIFLIALIILVAYYVRWFRLTPPGQSRDTTFTFSVGFGLLVVNAILAFIFSLAYQRLEFKAVLIIVDFTLVAINGQYLDIHMPRMIISANCNGATYFVTDNTPFLDEQWPYRVMSKWAGAKYKYSYSWYLGNQPDTIICDGGKKETNFIGFGNLLFTDGEDKRSYVFGASAKFREHRYFLSDEWIVPVSCTSEQFWMCSTNIYTLYECDLDYTGCHPLPITFKGGGANIYHLTVDKEATEITLIEESVEYSGDGDETIVFTYGENPRCFVDGCSITNQ